MGLVIENIHLYDVQVLMCTVDAYELASRSWCQAPIWDPRPDFYYCQLRVC
jgi:hypothetical protein